MPSNHGKTTHHVTNTAVIVVHTFTRVESLAGVQEAYGAYMHGLRACVASFSTIISIFKIISMRLYLSSRLFI